MFKEVGMKADEVLGNLDELLSEDATYSSGNPIASMSTTPNPLGVKIFAKTLEKNAGRLLTFRGSARVEQEVIQMLGDLLHLKSAAGTTTSGGTESNILAMLAARENAPENVTDPEIIAPITVHSSVDRAAWLLGIRLVKTNVDSEFKAEIDSIEKHITKSTI